MEKDNFNPGIGIFEYNKFTEKKKLGQGEFGVVYRAAYLPNFKKVAIRIISRGYRACGSEDIENLMQEAFLPYSITSENVVRMLGVVIESEHLCIVLEYAKYGSLDKVIQQLHKDMELPLKIRFALDIVRGMIILHDKQIIHSRMKGSCIFVFESMRAKIGDVCMGGNKELKSWTTIGRGYSQGLPPIEPSNFKTNSAAYLPPERIGDINRQADNSGDVYGFSIVLWELLSGQIAYKDVEFEKICKNVRSGSRPDTSLILDEFRQILEECWHDHSEKRPSFKVIETKLSTLAQKFDENVTKNLNKCKAILDDFNPDCPKNHVAPVCDLAGHRQILRDHHSPAVADGAAAAVSSSDKKVSVVPLIPPPVGNKSGQQDAREGTSTEDNSQTVPAEKTMRIANPEDFYNVAEHLGARRWRRFGTHLGFSNGQLDNIEANYSRSGYPEIPYQMLRTWKEGSRVPVTMAYLVEILKGGNLHEIAQKLSP